MQERNMRVYFNDCLNYDDILKNLDKKEEI